MSLNDKEKAQLFDAVQPMCFISHDCFITEQEWCAEMRQLGAELESVVDTIADARARRAREKRDLYEKAIDDIRRCLCEIDLPDDLSRGATLTDVEARNLDRANTIACDTPIGDEVNGPLAAAELAIAKLEEKCITSPQTSTTGTRISSSTPVDRSAASRK